MTLIEFLMLLLFLTSLLPIIPSATVELDGPILHINGDYGDGMYVYKSAITEHDNGFTELDYTFYSYVQAFEMLDFKADDQTAKLQFRTYLFSWWRSDGKYGYSYLNFRQHASDDSKVEVQVQTAARVTSGTSGSAWVALDKNNVYYYGILVAYAPTVSEVRVRAVVSDRPIVSYFDDFKVRVENTYTGTVDEHYSGNDVFLDYKSVGTNWEEHAFIMDISLLQFAKTVSKDNGEDYSRFDPSFREFTTVAPNVINGQNDCRFYSLKDGLNDVVSTAGSKTDGDVTTAGNATGDGDEDNTLATNVIPSYLSGETAKLALAEFNLGHNTLVKPVLGTNVDITKPVLNSKTFDYSVSSTGFERVDRTLQYFHKLMNDIPNGLLSKIKEYLDEGNNLTGISTEALGATIKTWFQEQIDFLHGYLGRLETKFNELEDRLGTFVTDLMQKHLAAWFNTFMSDAFVDVAIDKIGERLKVRLDNDDAVWNVIDLYAKMLTRISVEDDTS